MLLNCFLQSSLLYYCSSTWQEDAQYAQLEESTIRLFAELTACHPANQKLFASTLHGILESMDSVGELLDNYSSQFHMKTIKLKKGYIKNGGACLEDRCWHAVLPARLLDVMIFKFSADRYVIPISDIELAFYGCSSSVIQRGWITGQTVIGFTKCQDIESAEITLRNFAV